MENDKNKIQNGKQSDIQNDNDKNKEDSKVLKVSKTVGNVLWVICEVIYGIMMGLFEGLMKSFDEKPKKRKSKKIKRKR